MLTMTLLSLLLGCGEPQTETPPEAPVDAAPEQPVAGEASEATAPKPAGKWVVAPTSIRHSAEDQLISVQADIKAPQGSKGDQPVYVGVTVVTQSGEEIDLMVHTLLPGTKNEGVLFSTSIDGDAQDVLIGVWGTKVEPCEVDRYGCREFGFVLDDSLGSWPEGLYTDGKRRRILPAQVPITVTGSGGAMVAEVLPEALAQDFAMFGSKPVVTVVESGDDEAPEGVVVTYGHPSDELMADDIASLVGSVLELGSAKAVQGDTEAHFSIAIE